MSQAPRYLRPKTSAYGYAQYSELYGNSTEKSGGPYVRYNKKDERDALDQNTVMSDNVSVFPFGIYAHPTMEDPDFLCDSPRDKRSNYVYGRERYSHPQHFSRFARADSWNGYGVGNWSSGKYKVSDACYGSDLFDDPPGMAPPELYGETPYTVTSRGGQTYEWAKDRI